MCGIGTFLIVAIFLVLIACFILIIIYNFMNSPDYTYTDEPRFPKIPEKYQRNKKDEKEV